MTRYLLPLGIFIGLVVLLAAGLTLNPRYVPSPLIDKPAPVFSLPQLHRPDQSISPADMLGKVWLLNVWASWCVACRAEHPLMNELARSGEVAIIGLNYKDRPEAALQWLRQLDNPYRISAVDEAGRAGIDWGVYGVPETFVVDKQGIIRYKHVGPVEKKDLEETILPLVRQLVQKPA
ncbi:DsbE family thiol:disulfide interchange protein [Sulfuriflexus mobilis]|uniref:DsbE family thiol:disulfide interchange protein n=1 Tax=Sulfuriflexus mobilis TaxID=1811807 RepID=UPI000F8179AF|nr:DsbE family thiol:disulfide interchange protein [Sulfuriflexus mobilis]